jgi:hypothetical protein
MPQTNGQRESIELKNLRSKRPKSDLDTVERKPWSQRRKLIFVLSVIICIFVTLLCIFAIPWNDLCCGHGQMSLLSEEGYNSTHLNETEPTASINVEPSSAQANQITPSTKSGGQHSNYKRSDPWTYTRKGFGKN